MKNNKKIAAALLVFSIECNLPGCTVNVYRRDMTQ